MIITSSELNKYYDSRRITDLADDNNDGAADTGVLDAVINAACELIYAMLRKVEPDTSVIDAAASLKKAAASIAMYYLEQRRGDLTDGIRQAYQETMTYITALANGDAILPETARVYPQVSPDTLRNVYEQSGYFEGLSDDTSSD